MYRRRHLGYIFQMYNLIPNLTVRENIEVGAYLSEKPLDVDELLKLLGLCEHRANCPTSFPEASSRGLPSEGPSSKIRISCLCDEPTGALDYNTSKDILKLIETVNQKYGSTVVMVTHNAAIRDMADRVVRLRDGMIRENTVNQVKTAAENLEW